MTISEPILRPVTGWSGSPEYFAPREYDGFVPEAALDVLRGRTACVVFRGMLAPELCARIAERFWSSPARQTRGAEAPGYYLGTYTWNKTTDAYFAESATVNPVLRDLLDIPGDPMKEFYAGLSRVLAAEGSVVRPARHKGREASLALLRSWHGAGTFALEPHDDLSQCDDPQMAGFERIGVLDHVVGALNICLENHEGGRLVYWNVQPDADSRERLGIRHTGSPYPVESLAEYETQHLQVRTGDVYVFNGAHVHAVEPNTDDTQTRTTLAAMLGFIDDHTVGTWS